MLVTCTMNPAIDLFVQTESYLPQIVNRSLKDDIQPNGKGVNVSFILKMLGLNNTAIGFSAGFTGHFVEEELAKKGIIPDFVHVTGLTRINVFTQVVSDHAEYKLVNRGPEITPTQIEELLQKIEYLKAGDLLCVSGSNPQGVNDDVLVKIAAISAERKARFVLDSSTSAVLDVLPFRPYLLKPNDEELAALFQRDHLTEEEIIYYAKELVTRGAQQVLVSAGSKGSYYINQDTVLFANAPKGKLVNSACAGDTLLGTFIAMTEKKHPLADSLKYSVAAGSSTAFTEGLTDFTDVDTLMEQIRVTEL